MRITRRGAAIPEVTRAKFAAVSAAETPTGIAAVVRRRWSAPGRPSRGDAPVRLASCEVRSPWFLGTTLRTGIRRAGALGSTPEPHGRGGGVRDDRRRGRRATSGEDRNLSGASVRVLAGDAGGTNTRVAVFDATEGAAAADALRLVEMRRYASREAKGLSDIVAGFLRETGLRGERASFGIAGPVRDGRVRATNLPWEVDAAEVAAAAGLPSASLLNDLEANAWGLRALPAEAFVTLQAGVPGAGGNAALLSAGTGLGEAGLHWDGREHRPFACEGGHASFAPRTPLEIALLEHLARRYGHVSWERVLSGPGLVNVWRFLLARCGAAEPGWTADAERRNELGAKITAAGLDGSDPVCSEALDLLVGFYGAEAGNLALKMLATGGVHVGGGIAPRIRSRLEGPRFLEAFLDKGRMRPLLEAMPVRLVVDDRAALFGAAWHAAFEQVEVPR